MSEPVEEEIRLTAPTFPSELTLNSSKFFFQKLPGGGMTLKFAPSVATPQGQQILPLPIAINFDGQGWERFKRAVEVDGELPNVVIPDMNGNRG